jgi:hypothetical protein
MSHSIQQILGPQDKSDAIVYMVQNLACPAEPEPPRKHIPAEHVISLFEKAACFSDSLLLWRSSLLLER